MGRPGGRKSRDRIAVRQAEQEEEERSKRTKIGRGTSSQKQDPDGEPEQRGKHHTIVKNGCAECHVVCFHIRDHGDKQNAKDALKDCTSVERRTPADLPIRLERAGRDCEIAHSQSRPGPLQAVRGGHCGQTATDHISWYRSRVIVQQCCRRG